eukprot:351996-Hanusia_phi.AAC.1
MPRRLGGSRRPGPSDDQMLRGSAAAGLLGHCGTVTPSRRPATPGFSASARPSGEFPAVTGTHPIIA